MNKINVIQRNNIGISQKITPALAALFATVLLSGFSLSIQAATITVDSLADTFDDAFPFEATESTDTDSGGSLSLWLLFSFFATTLLRVFFKT